jgi:hypothetical protein
MTSFHSRVSRTRSNALGTVDILELVPGCEQSTRIGTADDSCTVKCGQELAQEKEDRWD